MKHFNFTLLFTLMTALVLFNACSKDEPDPDPIIEDTAPSFSAKIDVIKVDSLNLDYQNVSFNSDFDKTVYIEDLEESFTGAEAQMSGDTLAIFAAQIAGNDTSYLGLQAILDADRLGTYTISTYNIFEELFGGEPEVPEAGGIFYSSQLPEEMLFLVFFAPIKAGSVIEITEFDAINKTISGNFNFTYQGENDNGSRFDVMTISNGQFSNLTFETLP